MDNRLVLTVLFVTLSWMSINTYAQTSSTSMPNSMTATAHNMTNMTSPAHNASASPAPSPTHNTTADPTTNMTSPTHNMTSTTHSMTSTTHSMTSATHNMTSATHNMTSTTHNMTTAPPSTAATTAPPLTPNTTVETLETPVSRAGCGTEQLCAASPADCDPSNSGSCFFFAAKLQSGQNFEFSLSGDSDGYLATTLSPDTTVGNNDTTYVCAKNNSVVLFFGTILNNDQLTRTELNVNSVKGKVNGTKIQCTFAATVPQPRIRRSAFSVSISTGPFDTNTGTLGSPRFQFRSPVVDLQNPNSSVPNELSTTTTTISPTTASHAITFQQSLMQALLISVGVLGLAML